MTIPYVLVEYPLRDEALEYRAIVRPVDTVDLERLVDHMLRRTSTVGRADILGVMADFFRTVEELLLEGINVTTPVANFHTSIKGVFQSTTDRYDPGRHQVVARVSPGGRLRRAIQTYARVTRKPAVDPVPHPLQYIDVNTGASDSILSSGGMGRLLGARLKFDPGDPRQGIFFVAADRTATRVGVVAENKPRKLIFLVPNLAPGAYTLEVRAIMRGGTVVRRGALPGTLTVP